MRKIKFRAWDETKKLMLTVTDIAWDYRDGKGLAEIMCINPSGCEYDPFEYRPEHVKLLQFTGLKDCNGVDIYEGDIIQFRISTINGNLAPPHIFEVINKKGCFKAGHMHFSQFNCYDIIEVIGNKFENPELLK